jgi:cytochrome c2
MRVRTGVLVVVIALGTVGAYGVDAYNRQQGVKAEAAALTGGDPDRAPELIVRYGCAGCHTIPGVPRATGRVGPPLGQVAGRVYLGGVVTNRPDHLVRWILNPRAANSKSAMPVTGISEPDARHVAAYLLTLR